MIQLLDKLKEGRSFAAVAHHCGINELTVRYIKKDESMIRKTSVISFNKDAKRAVTWHNKMLMKLKSALTLWIADYRKKNVSLDINMIRTKEKTFLAVARPNDDDDDDHGEEEDINDSQLETSCVRGQQGLV